MTRLIMMQIRQPADTRQSLADRAVWPTDTSPPLWSGDRTATPATPASPAAGAAGVSVWRARGTRRTARRTTSRPPSGSRWRRTLPMTRSRDSTGETHLTTLRTRESTSRCVLVGNISHVEINQLTFLSMISYQLLCSLPA